MVVHNRPAVGDQAAVLCGKRSVAHLRAAAGREGCRQAAVNHSVGGGGGVAVAHREAVGVRRALAALQGPHRGAALLPAGDPLAPTNPYPSWPSPCPVTPPHRAAVAHPPTITITTNTTATHQPPHHPHSPRLPPVVTQRCRPWCRLRGRGAAGRRRQGSPAPRPASGLYRAGGGMMQQQDSAASPQRSTARHGTSTAQCSVARHQCKCNAARHQRNAAQHGKGGRAAGERMPRLPGAAGPACRPTCCKPRPTCEVEAQAGGGAGAAPKPAHYLLDSAQQLVTVLVGRVGVIEACGWDSRRREGGGRLCGGSRSR